MIQTIEAPIILAHSISPEGIEMITWQLRYWRGIHSELMTHRALSKSAGSSRARPSQGIIDQVATAPWGPARWGKNQPGMQAFVDLQGDELEKAQAAWREMALQAANGCQQMLYLGLHKQIVNRPLEPYTYIDVVVSGTDWNNFFHLRDEKNADPSFQLLASSMKEVKVHSEPTLLQPGEWHLPYITDEDRRAAEAAIDPFGAKDHPLFGLTALDLLKRASAARCARVSYKLFDGTAASFEKDLELYKKLMIDQPIHASPTEHQATPDVVTHHVDGEPQFGQEFLHGNLRGWCQFRKTIPNEYLPG